VGREPGRLRSRLSAPSPIAGPRARRAALVLAALWSAAAPALSVPSFNNLFDKHAGYPASCALCHQPQDWRATPYSREFLRLNRGFAALKALDLMDPDDDGVPSRDEIESRSNPGDARSTPDHPGDWLSHSLRTPPPRRFLAPVFGPLVEYEVVEKRLKDDQVSRIEEEIGQSLRDEDRFPTVFRVWESAEPFPAFLSPGQEPEPSSTASGGRTFLLARVGYAYEGTDHLSVYVVVTRPDGSLWSLRPVRVPGDQRLGGEDYLRQFVGKRADQLAAVAAPRGAEAGSARLVEAVRRCLEVMDVLDPPAKEAAR
jgi:hypothetical protein